MQSLTLDDENVEYQPYEDSYAIRVHEFSDGGCEVFMRRVWSAKRLELHRKSRELLDARTDALVERVKADDAELVKEQNMSRAARRARAVVRWRVREERFDHLVTLTYRENVEDIERVKKDWKRLVRGMHAVYPDWRFCAVPEKQQRGAWHVHVAVKGFQDVRLLRKLWWAIVGRAMGNIDVRAPMGRWTDQYGDVRSWTPRKLSGYLSKYIAKTFAELAGGKKRYWASSMPDITVHRLSAAGGEFTHAYRTVIDFVLGDRAFDLQQWCDSAGDVFWCTAPPSQKPHESI